MLDPKIIRDEPDKIRKMITDRAVKFDFDNMLELDKKRRGLIQETDELRKKRNQMSIAIGKAKKSNEDISNLLSDMEIILYFLKFYAVYMASAFHINLLKFRLFFL